MRTRLNLILVVALLLSSLAWVPNVQANANPDQAGPASVVLAAARTLKLRIVNREISVRGTGYTKGQRFVVAARTNDSRKWYTLGVVRAKNTGKINGVFSLPLRLAYSEVVRVCLVDIEKGTRTCGLVIRRGGVVD